LELTDKQKIFVNEYVVDFNATRSAIKAGYSKSSARMIGMENLTKPYIREAIDKTINDLNEKCHIKREKVINEIASIAFDDMSNYMDFTSNSAKLKNSEEIDTKNIQELSFDRWGQPKLKLYSRDTALYKLAEYLGMSGIGENGSQNDYEKELTIEQLRGLLNESKSTDNPKT
jgi:phage terminase small subunit